MEPEKTLNRPRNPEKENQSRRHHNSGLKLYYKAVIIKTVWYWHKNTHSDQWKRTENQEMNPQMYGQLIFDKAGKTIQWNKDSLFSKRCWENCTVTCRKMNLGHFLTPYTKVNSKWMKDLNVTQEAIKILMEKAGKNLSDPNHSNYLLNTSPEARETKTKMNYWDLIKIKSFCTTKETISKTKRQLTEWEKIFANDLSVSIQNL